MNQAFQFIIIAVWHPRLSGIIIKVNNFPEFLRVRKAQAQTPPLDRREHPAVLVGVEHTLRHVQRPVALFRNFAE